MKVEVKVPVLAESVAEATLGSWLKKQGDGIKKGENLIEIETDKVVLEITAPEAGVLAEIRRKEGADVQSDEVIALIDTEIQANAEVTAAVISADNGKATNAGISNDEHEAVAATSQAQNGMEITADQNTSEAHAAKTGPAVRKLLKENALSADDIAATGMRGRITKADVQKHIDEHDASMSEDVPDQMAGNDNTGSDMSASGRVEKRVPMTRLRKRVAERLMAAQQQNAILTTFNDVNMQPVMELRSRYKERFEQAHKVRLGYMSFFATAAVEALKRFPIVNAFVEQDDIVYHGYFDIGIAVSSPRGLVVPILRDVESLSMAGIESQIAEFVDKAKENRLSLEDLTGGTFTITNGGIFGSLLSTPILNPPQSAILGMHRIEERPVAVNGQVVVRPMMYLALSYDHRIIDGREAVQFLVAIKDMIEDPSRLLLQV